MPGFEANISRPLFGRFIHASSHKLDFKTIIIKQDRAQLARQFIRQTEFYDNFNANIHENILSKKSRYRRPSVPSGKVRIHQRSILRCLLLFIQPPIGGRKSPSRGIPYEISPVSRPFRCRRSSSSSEKSSGAFGSRSAPLSCRRASLLTSLM